MKQIMIGIVFLLSATVGFAQRQCASHDNLQLMILNNPEMAKTVEYIERHTQDFISKPQNGKERAVITIPIVFHIVWRTGKTVENISDAQVQSQLDVINKDFRKLNADVSKTPALFAALAADSEIQFCMAQRTPSGVATTGIVRYQSSRTTDWGTTSVVKTTYAPWDATKYLNVWVCSIGGGILGYAQFPGGSTATDGVVVDYRYFGTTGTATAPFHLGRTLTHEIGHWLNLRHIWGDANCGTDSVTDTPTHTTSNGACPAFPKTNTCGGTTNTEMTMNYMDYTDDACMYMFSAGQKARMQALFASGGARASLLTSNGCTPGTTATCGTPTTLAAAAITTTGATLSWAAVTGASSYTLQYKKSTSTTWTTVSSLTTTSRLLTGLTAGTAYNFQVAAVCPSITSAYSTAANFSTLANCTDAYENNNSSAKAFTLTAGTYTALISTATDQDWFKVTTTAAAKNIRATISNLPADFNVALYSSTNALLMSSTNAGTTNDVVKYNGATGAATYYIKVNSASGAFSSTSCYTLLIETSASNLREIGQMQEDNATALDFSVYPNPASEEVVLNFATESSFSTDLSIHDMTGRTISTQKAFISNENNRLLLDVSGLENGFYFITARNSAMQKTAKLMIER
jgi:hypothetical protein